MRPLEFCPQAVIFDMDGLLIDSEPVWEEVEGALLRSRGVEMSAELRARLMGMRMTDFWGGIHAAYRLADPVEVLIDEAVRGMAARIGSDAPPRPGALALIAFIQQRGIPSAIASSSPTTIIDAVVQAHHWESVFAIRVSGSEVPAGKPAPDIYLEAARRLGVEPRCCLALEDSVNGARAAAAAGMTVIAVPDPTHSTPESFRDITGIVYPSLHEVRRALEGCDFAR